jgi:translation elongation factor P/translation initiation factor 5A
MNGGFRQTFGMKLNRFAIGLLVSIPCLLLAGCSSTPPAKVDRKVEVKYTPNVPGGSLVETYRTSARLIAVNPSTRQMTFVASDGSTNTFRAGTKFMKFDSYRVGDQVNVTVARELVMYLAGETPPAAPGVDAVVRGTPGSEPGVLTAAPRQLTATVSAVEPQKHVGTLQMADGTSGTFNVRPDVDLTQVKLGSEVVIRTSSAMAVMLEKP